MIAKVKYKIADYKGTVLVVCDENDDDYDIILKAQKVIRTSIGFIPFAKQSWKIIERN